VAAAVAATAPMFSSRARAQGADPSDKLLCAVIGCRGRGGDHIGAYSGRKDVQIAYIVDVDEKVGQNACNTVEKRTGRRPKWVKDLREVFDDKSVHFISTATPNHWHALVTVWACQAGKHVYVEKPVCHNIWEGRRMVEAARKYKRIVQSGTQRRSDEGLREALEYIKQGNLGEMRLIRGFIYVRRDSIGEVDGPQPVPESVDYNLWCGPAPMAPLMRKRLHYDWHWTWPTGDGDFGNNGIHYIDICRWFAGQNELAPRVLGFGGRFGYVDDGETPNTEILFYDYKPVPILFELRGRLGLRQRRQEDQTVRSHRRRGAP